MTFGFRFALACVVATLISTRCADARKGRNPCHPNRTTEFLSTDCEAIVMPKKMCRKCRLAGFDNEGFFPDCAAIYDLDAPGCLAGIQEYVDLNPCDETRKDQLEGIATQRNRQGLDYFVYSVCEECCDCIPDGARPDEYDERRELGVTALTALTRGNCPAHARFDICRIWPEIRDIVPPGQLPGLDRPKICPEIEAWFQSPAADNWLQNPNVEINRVITRFLRRFNWITRCRSRSVWEQCTALEAAQERI